MKLWSWMSIWIFLISLKASVLNTKGEKVKKHYTHTYSHFVRAEFCSTFTMSHAKENRKWWQEPENWVQAMLCHPWALHQGTWGYEKCNTTRSKLLYIWTSRAALCLKPPFAYANINVRFYLAMNQIGSLLWLTKKSHVWSLMCWSSLPLANKLKIIHPAYSGRLSFVPGKPVAAEHWLCRMHISVPWAKGPLVGAGSISIHRNGNVCIWFKGIKWLTEIQSKMVCEVSSSFGYFWKALQSGVN